MHSGVAIDLLALEAGAGSRRIKRHSETRSGEERPVPGCDESRQLHGGVGREQELAPEQRWRFRGLEGWVRGKEEQRVGPRAWEVKTLQ